MTTKTKNQIKEIGQVLLVGTFITFFSYALVLVFHYGIAPVFDKLLGF